MVKVLELSAYSGMCSCTVVVVVLALLTVQFGGSPVECVRSSSSSGRRGPIVWPARAPPGDDDDSYVLPETISPTRYVVSVVPDLVAKRFHGDVIVDGRTDRADFLSDRIVLNSFDLKIGRIEVEDASRNGTRVPVASHHLRRAPQWLVVNLGERLTPNTDYRLRIWFSGKFGSEYGLYYAAYEDDSAKSGREMAMTEFQATYARTVFPCWDEPRFKASFVMRVARFPTEIALSNMPLMETSSVDQSEQGRVWDTFEASPEMSSYLVAFVVAELSGLSGGRNLTVWTQPGKEAQGRFALDLTGRLMAAMEAYTGIDYLLPKLDQVALPKLGHQAMEHWGIVTYSERFLVVDDADSLKQKQQVAFHVSHELSHQWFGNLVTLEWWNLVWLNEGFAEFFQYYLLELLEPEWRMVEIFVVNEVQSMLSQDAFLYTHPLNMPNVRNTVQIEKMFDLVSYCKGGAIVRMLFHIMTPELFQLGIKEYLSVNSLKTVTEEDLWDGLSSVEHCDLDLPADIAELMYHWTHQEGYPLLMVQRDEDGSVNLTQRRFLISNDSYAHTPDASWWIPLSYTTNSELDFNDTKPKEWFNASMPVHQLELNLDEDEWIIFNVQQTGFYRVNYDAKTWSLIIDDMVNCQSADVHPLNRAQLLDDSFTLAKTGYIDYSVALNLTRYLLHETDVIPWTTAFDIFKTLEAKLIGTPARPLFRRHVQTLVSNWFSSIGYEEKEGDCVATRLNRMTVMAVACGFGHAGCVEKALQQVYLLMSEADVKIPTDLEDVVLCTAVNAGPEEVWQFVRKKYIASKSRKERESLLEAMACSQDPNKILQMLEDSVDKKSAFFKSNEGSILIAALTRRKTNSETMLNFFYDNFHQIAAMYGEEKLKNYFMYATLHVNPIQVEKLYKFIAENEKHMNMSMERVISLESFIKNSMRSGTWYNSYYHEIFNWLREERAAFGDDVTASSGEVASTPATDDVSEIDDGAAGVVSTTEIWLTEEEVVEEEEGGTVDEQVVEYDELTTTEKENSGAGEDDEGGGDDNEDDGDSDLSTEVHRKSTEKEESQRLPSSAFVNSGSYWSVVASVAIALFIRNA